SNVVGSEDDFSLYREVLHLCRLVSRPCSNVWQRPVRHWLRATDDLSKESIRVLIWQRVFPLVDIYWVPYHSYPSIHRQPAYPMVSYQKGFFCFFKYQFIARE